MAPPAIGLVPMAKAGASIAATTGVAILGGTLTVVGGALIVAGVVGIGHLAYRVSSHGLNAASKRRSTSPTSSSARASGAATQVEEKPSPIPEKGSAANLHLPKTALVPLENSTLADTDASAGDTNLPEGKKFSDSNAERESKTPLPHTAAQVAVSASLGGEGVNDARSETPNLSIIRTNVNPARKGLSGPEALPGNGTGGVSLLNPEWSGKSSTPRVSSGTISDSNPRVESVQEPPVDEQHPISRGSSNATSQVNQDQDAAPAPISHAETKSVSSPLEFTPTGSTLRRRARRRGNPASTLPIETRNMGIAPQTTGMDASSYTLDTTQLDARLLRAAPAASNNVHTNRSSVVINTSTQGPTTQTENMSSPRSPGSQIHSPNRPNQFESPWAALYRSG